MKTILLAIVRGCEKSTNRFGAATSRTINIQDENGFEFSVPVNEEVFSKIFGNPNPPVIKITVETIP